VRSICRENVMDGAGQSYRKSAVRERKKFYRESVVLKN